MTTLEHLQRLPYPINELAVEEWNRQGFVSYLQYKLPDALRIICWHGDNAGMGQDFWLGVLDEIQQEVILRQAMIECKERNINFDEHFKIVRR